MKRIIYDTGIYVGYLRRGELVQAVETSTQMGLVHLSVVVAEELIVGAPDRSAERFLDRLIRRFDGLNRLEVPNQFDWLRAGHAIRAIGQSRGYELVGRARITNDALIMATAFRIGATVATRDVADFTILREHIAATIVQV